MADTTCEVCNEGIDEDEVDTCVLCRKEVCDNCCPLLQEPGADMPWTSRPVCTECIDKIKAMP